MACSARVGDMGSIPGPGGSHMPQINYSRAWEWQLLNPRTTTAEAREP